MGYQYRISNTSAGAAISTAITVLQYKAGAAKAARLLAVRLSQGAGEVSTQESLAVLRKTAAATVTSFTPIELQEDGPAAAGVGGTSATGYTASGEGTDGDILHGPRGWNVVGDGFVWLPLAEGLNVWIPAAGIIALKFLAAPASATWFAEMYVEEF